MALDNCTVTFQTDRTPLYMGMAIWRETEQNPNCDLCLEHCSARAAHLECLERLEDFWTLGTLFGYNTGPPSSRDCPTAAAG